ncbi:MAG: hypothetical protein ACKVOK_12440 [Flavobacteriales bacterium]
MKKEIIQYWKDRLKYVLVKIIAGENRRVKTPMQQIILTLRLKQLLPKQISAIELFGMHGLWHTMDYVPLVKSLDIFEINKSYHELSKKLLKKYPTRFFHEDSIRFIASTNLNYNFVVADIPYGGDFYAENGLPHFFEDLVRIMDASGGVLIFNCHSRFLKSHKILQQHIESQIKKHVVMDLFFLPRNDNISYIVLCLSRSPH